MYNLQLKFAFGYFIKYLKSTLAKKQNIKQKSKFELQFLIWIKIAKFISISKFEKIKINTCQNQH